MTPEDEQSVREAQEGLKRRDPPRDEEEAASFEGMGQAITTIREHCDLSREEVAQTAEMPLAELDSIVRGEIHARWGDLRRIAKGLGVPLPALLREAEEHAPGPGGEAWRKWSGEAEENSTVPRTRRDAAVGRKEP